MVVYGEGRYRCSTHGEVTPGTRRREDLDRGLFEPRCPYCGQGLEPLPVPETAPLHPRNVYAATKLHQEHLVESYAREHGARALMLRYHNVYGPRMPRDTPYAGVASILRSAVERGEAPLVFEDGQQRRDFVHVHDVARANLAALEAPAGVAGAFNICTGTPHTVADLAHTLVQATGGGGPAPRVVGSYRVGDVRHVFASPDLARTCLGFEAIIGFEAGMREFIAAPLRT